MDFKVILKQKLNKICESQGWTTPNFVIETPKNPEHGDFSTNMAMMLTRELRKNPREIAQAIVDNIERSYIDDVMIAGPGFINFKMEKSSLNEIVIKILEENQNFLRAGKNSKEKVNVEFISANPTGNLHIGHARNASVGDSVAKILDFTGHDVTSEYYINDAGAQIDKLGLSTLIRYKQALGQDDVLPTDAYHGPEIIELGKELALEFDNKWVHIPYDVETGMITDEVAKEEIKNIAKARMLERIKKTVTSMGVKMDLYVPELQYHSVTSEFNIHTALDQIKAYTYEKDGALWVNTTKSGDDKDRVVKKSNGYYTYLAPDIAYHAHKLQRGFGRIIDVWGADHHGYIPRVRACLGFLGLPNDKFDVIIIQMAKLIKDGQEFKMSKRTGKALTIDELIGHIGKDALRYYMISSAPGSHLEIDVDIAMKQSSENPVFYIQYAHARIHQVLANIELDDNTDLSLLNSEKEEQIIKHMTKFQDVIALASEKLEPHRLANYAFDLAKLFHSFYNSCKIADDSNKELSQQRAKLAKAVANLIKLNLSLLGINAPVRM